MYLHPITVEKMLSEEIMKNSRKYFGSVAKKCSLSLSLWDLCKQKKLQLKMMLDNLSNQI